MFDSVVKSIGNPYYMDEHCAIFNNDCLSILDNIPSDSINLTFTSPPYNIGKAFEIVKPLDDYIKWCNLWIDKIHKVTSKNGSFLLNIGYLAIEGKAHAVPISYLLWNKIPFYLQQEIIWNYGAGVSCKKYLSPRHETIL